MTKIDEQQGDAYLVKGLANLIKRFSGQEVPPHSSYLVCGPKGSGKTELLYEASCFLARSAMDIPPVIPLMRLVTDLCYRKNDKKKIEDYETKLKESNYLFIDDFDRIEHCVDAQRTLSRILNHRCDNDGDKITMISAERRMSAILNVDQGMSDCVDGRFHFVPLKEGRPFADPFAVQRPERPAIREEMSDLPNPPDPREPYNGRKRSTDGKKEDPVKFLQRIWGDYIEKGLLYTQHLRQVDPSLYSALKHYGSTRTPKMSWKDFKLVTKSDLVLRRENSNRSLSSRPSPPRE